MNASDNDDGNIRCSRSRFALIITLLVRDRGQVEEKRSDKPDSELKNTESVDNPAKAFNSLPKQAASQEDGFGEHIEISTAFAIAEPCVGARALLRSTSYTVCHGARTTPATRESVRQCVPSKVGPSRHAC